MSAEENKAAVRRFINEYQTDAREEIALELLAEDFVDHSALPGFSPDKTGVMNLFLMLRGAFGGLRVEIHDQVADDQKVVTRKTFRGTHSGEFFGVPPTNRPIEFGVIDILTVSGGQLKEHWCEVDFCRIDESNYESIKLTLPALAGGQQVSTVCGSGRANVSTACVSGWANKKRRKKLWLFY